MKDEIGPEMKKMRIKHASRVVFVFCPFTESTRINRSFKFLWLSGVASCASSGGDLQIHFLPVTMSNSSINSTASIDSEVSSVLFNNHTGSASMVPGKIDDVDKYITAKVTTTVFKPFEDFLRAMLGANQHLVDKRYPILHSIASSVEVEELRNNYCKRVYHGSERYDRFCELVNHTISQLPGEAQRPSFVFCGTGQDTSNNNHDHNIVVLRGQYSSVDNNKWKDNSSGSQDAFMAWLDIQHIFNFKLNKKQIKYTNEAAPPDLDKWKTPNNSADDSFKISKLVVTTHRRLTAIADPSSATTTLTKKRCREHEGDGSDSASRKRHCGDPQPFDTPDSDLLRQSFICAIDMMSFNAFMGDPRVFRVIAFEQLYGIHTVKDLDIFKQLFRDIFQGHHFFFNCLRLIKHRDISVESLLYHTMPDETSRGAMNDGDLTKVGKATGINPKGTGTGTQPFMSLDILVPNPPDHLERFDWESMFYVLLWIACHYVDGEDVNPDALKYWLERDMALLIKIKQSDLRMIDHALTTTQFEPLAETWLDSLRKFFNEGYLARDNIRKNIYYTRSDEFV
ncbi:hypothetical protein EW145_g2312 [Phellinidium pouzarii]|uniref:Fungal-type protein kinase domain-containing protein n=1 Tax=Phellinidium pouzarii TaxID=167371 RepID=A0A4S4LD80_9AGAM|nr:hypothetical protein EW145_g2312 [Phellinidium pouzarii]